MKNQILKQFFRSFFRIRILIISCLGVVFTYTVLANDSLTTQLMSNAGSDAHPWLVKADSYLAEQNSKIEIEITIYKNNKLTKSRQYTVYTQPPRKSLVVFKTPIEKGQKVLMKEHNFWLFIPNSKRPIRITPQQKLFGDAATGDIATIRWSDDYKGVLEQCDEQLCQLKLQKKHKGPTYEKVILWLDKKNALPVKANLYLSSGRIAKSATYHSHQTDNKVTNRTNNDAAKTKGSNRIINYITFQDEIKKSRKTQVEFVNIQTTKVPNLWFSPGYVSQNQIE